MFDIRELEIKDLGEAMSLVWEVFVKYQGCDYSEEGISSFKEFIKIESITEGYYTGVYKFWGCFEDGILLGVICKRDLCHLAMLFVKGETHKSGIGKLLFETLRDDIRRDKLIKKITVNSSPYAVGFYKRMGFEETDKEKCINGIKFTPMVFCLERFWQV